MKENSPPHYLSTSQPIKMDITVQELKQRLDAGENDFVLIDVREPIEREEFNIGGLHVPLGSLSQSLVELDEHKGQEVIVYCRSGNRSGMAAGFLKQNGFQNARNLLGGMLAWQKL